VRLAVGDHFINRNGSEVARILVVAKDHVEMERRPTSKKSRRVVRFKLPRRFFDSPNCGWRRARDEGGT
jgi:hypothetical protein